MENAFGTQLDACALVTRLSAHSKYCTLALGGAFRYPCGVGRLA